MCNKFLHSCQVHCLRLFGASFQHYYLISKNLDLLLLYHVYYTSCLGRIYCHCIAIYRMIVMLLDSFVSVLFIMSMRVSMSMFEISTN